MVQIFYFWSEFRSVCDLHFFSFVDCREYFPLIKRNFEWRVSFRNLPCGALVQEMIDRKKRKWLGVPVRRPEHVTVQWAKHHKYSRRSRKVTGARLPVKLLNEYQIL